MYGKRRSTRKPRRGGRSKRSNRRSYRRVRKTIAPMETCCIKETLDLGKLVSNTAYEASVSLQEFPRALDLADSFQEYRICKLEYKYTPQYDTFASQYMPGTSNVSMTVPYLYSKRITQPTPLNWGLPYLENMGAKPRRLDDKTLTVSYTPNINLFGSSFTIPTTPVSTVNGLKPVKKPWLQTHQINPLTPTANVLDNTPHFGHASWIDQDVATLNGTTPCKCEVIAHFEFRKPWQLVQPSENAKVSL